MKLLALLTAAALLIASHAHAQTKNVTKTISTNGLVENLVVPSGKTLTINSGGSIVNNGTATGFTASAAWGSITGTLSSQTDLQTALNARQPLDSDLTSIAALSTTTFGRSLLALDDAAAGRSALGIVLNDGAPTNETIGEVPVYAAGAIIATGFSAQLPGVAGGTSIDLSGYQISDATGAYYQASSTMLKWVSNSTGQICIAPPALNVGDDFDLVLPPRNGTLICTGDTGTVTSAMLASGAAAGLGANTFTGLQQFSGTNHAGLRLNNLTTTQRDAIATPAAGMIIWNTTAARIQAYNGSAWTAGMVRLDGDTMTGTLVLPAGTVSAPSLTFGDSTSGIYRSASGEVALTSGGTQRLRSTSSGVTVTGTLTVGAGSIQDMGGGQLALGGSHYASGNGFFATTLLRISTSGLGAGNKAQWGVLAEGAAIQRDAATAQAFYVANTYTSATSYEAAGIRWSSNVAIFGPVKGSGGGSSRNAQYHTTETGVFWSSGSGSPESVVTAPVGSIYTRTDGGASTTLYIKESGTGNTGWIAK